MQIYGPSHVHSAQAIKSPHSSPAAQPRRTEAAARTSDTLELSDAARLASQMSDIPDIRHDRVSAIKQAIADGTYETDEKLSLALDRLFDELG